MCSPDIAIKSEEAEYTLPGPSQSDDQGAKAEHDVPELQLRPKSVDSKLATLNDEDNDDPLASLCALFDGLWPDSDSESQEASVKPEDAKHTLLTPSRCDNQGAKAEHDVSELQLQPNAVDPKLATLKAEDDDDPPTSPCAQSDGTWPDDDSDSDSNDSESRPGSPLCKGNSEILLETFTNNTGATTRRYFFYEGNCFYFDLDHNVYLEDNSGGSHLIHRGQLFLELGSNILDFEYIGKLPYYFGIDGNLWVTDQDFNPVQVPTFTWAELMSSTFSAMSSNATPNELLRGSNSDFQEQPQALVPSGAYCDDTKIKDIFNPNPLQNSLQGPPNVPWSPSSSTTKSPIVAASSRASSQPLELLSSQEPLIKSDWPTDLSLQLWKAETKVIQQEHKRVPDKLDRRRCKHCHKVFRRPSSLEDHLNVHSGAKPHMCPFERCTTGFATKSNMKRHFETHRVGKLEDYLREGKLKASNARTTTYNARAFYTQRFRLV